MSEITTLLVNRLVESLTAHCIDDVSASDQSRANIVKAYRFQDDPTENPVVIAIHSGNPEEPNILDGRIGIGDMEDLGIKIPSGEVGGGHLWWRRGRAEVRCTFTRDMLTQEEAAEAAHLAIGRVSYWIESTHVTDLIDEFGERAYKVFVYASHFNESGGPDNQYIWRGQILWQALTERPL